MFPGRKSDGFDLFLNDHIQWQPKQFHDLNSNIFNALEEAKNITMSFNTEIYNISNIDKKPVDYFVFASSDKKDVYIFNP